jgi:hypothetical protein
MKDSHLWDHPLEEHEAIRIPGPVKSIEQLKQELEALRAWRLESITATSAGRADRH